MTRAIFHLAARQELEETIDHYNAERQGLGREFREEVRSLSQVSTAWVTRPRERTAGNVVALSLPRVLSASGIRASPHSGGGSQSSPA